jgi:hypothetical protein
MIGAIFPLNQYTPYNGLNQGLSDYEKLLCLSISIQATHWAIESVPDSIAVNHEDDIEPGLPDRRAGGGTRASSSVRWVSA